MSYINTFYPLLDKKPNSYIRIESKRHISNVRSFDKINLLFSNGQHAFCGISDFTKQDLITIRDNLTRYIKEISDNG